MKWFRLLFVKKFHRPVSLLLSLVIGLLVSTAALLYQSQDTYTAALRLRNADLYGEQQVTVFNVQNDNLPDNAECGRFTVMGFLRTKVPLQEDPVIGSADETAVKLHHLRLKSGRLPEKAGEIAVESQLLPYLDAASPGDTVTLAYTVLDPEIGEFSKEREGSFVLVGVLENYTALQAPGSDFSERLPNVLWQEDLPGLRHVSLCFPFTPGQSDVYAAARSLGSDQYAVNTYALQDFIGDEIGYSDRMILSGLSVTVSICTAAVCVFLLVLYYLFQKDSRDQLRRLGATNGQLFLLSFCSGLYVLLPALLLAGLSAFFLPAVLRRILKSLFLLVVPEGSTSALLYRYLLLSLPVGVMLAAILSLLFVRLKHKPITRLFHRPYHLLKGSPVKLISRETRRAHWPRELLTVLIFGLCFILAGELCTEVRGGKRRYSTYCDYSLSQVGFMSAGPLRIATSDRVSFDANKVASLKQHPQVADVVTDSELMLNMETDDPTLQAMFHDARCFDGDFWSTEVFLEQCRALGFEGDVFSLALHCPEPALWDRLKPLTVAGQWTEDGLRSGRETVLVLRESERFPASEAKTWVGAAVHFVLFDASALPACKKLLEFSPTVTAVCVIPADDSLLCAAFSNALPMFAVLPAAIETRGIPAPITNVLINAVDPEQVEQLNADIQSLILETPNAKAFSNILLRLEEQKTNRFLSFIVDSIVFLLLAATLFTVMITEISVLRERLPLFRRLFALGMTRRQLYRVLVRGYLLNILWGLLIWLCVLALRSDVWEQTAAAGTLWFQLLLALLLASFSLILALVARRQMKDL